MNVSSKSKWKSVPIDPELMARGFSEGLLGIEELTDYQLIKVNKKKKPPVDVPDINNKLADSNSKSDKKIVSGQKRTLQNEHEANDSETPAKKKRKKKKKKIKKNNDSCPEMEEGTDKNDSKPPAEEQPDSNEQQTSTEVGELEGWKDMYIPKQVMQALKSLKYYQPTPIQRETLPAAINGHADIVGAAETGSGKTLSFAIPMVHGILEDFEKESLVKTEDESCEETSEKTCLTDSMPESDTNDEHDEESEEESDMEDPDATSGCVRVINDVEFDFEVDIEECSAADTVIPKKQKRKITKAPLRGLVLTPTRELAIQVRDHIQAICKFTKIKTVAIVGGMAVQKQIRLLDQAPEIVVATPGRVWDLIQDGHPHLNQVKTIRYFAIDETDRMVEKGHFEELQNLLEMLNQDETAKKQRQTFVFSATLSLVHDLPKHLAQKKGKKKLTPEEKMRELMDMIGVKSRPKIVDLTRKVGTAETLTESRIHCSATEKDLYLYYFLQQHPGRTMVFCNSIDCVRRLVNLFGLLFTEPLGLHAQMHQKQRLKNLERFTKQSNGFLIATDVAARGLDIQNVQHVVHYQVPRTSESYVHRSGRTARAQKEGVSIILIDPSENQFYKRMCRTLNRDEDLIAFPVEDRVLSAVKIRVNAARELDKLLLASKKVEVEKNWFKKAAQEAELEYSDSDSDSVEKNQFDRDVKNRQKASQKAKIKAKRAELTHLLATPLHAQKYSGKYITMGGKFQLPTDFKAVGSEGQSALQAMSKSKEEMKNLMKGSKPKANSNFKRKKKKNRIKNLANKPA